MLRVDDHYSAIKLALTSKLQTAQAPEHSDEIDLLAQAFVTCIQQKGDGEKFKLAQDLFAETRDDLVQAFMQHGEQLTLARYWAMYWQMCFMALDVSRVRADLELESELVQTGQRPEHKLGIVTTVHPCNAQPDAAVLQGHIVSVLASDAKPTAKLEQLQALFPQWFEAIGVTHKPTLVEETARNTRGVAHLAQAETEIAHSLNVPDGLTEQHAWGAIEADRNNVTWLTVLRSKVLHAQASVALYRAQLGKIQSANQDRQIALNLEELAAMLDAKDQHLHALAEQITQLVAVDYQRVVTASPGAQDKYIRFNLTEFFAGDINQLVNTAQAALLLADNGDWHVAEDRLYEEVMQGLQAHTTDLDFGELTDADADMPEPVITAWRDLQHMHQQHGMHYEHGQGRLDVQQSIKPAADALLEHLKMKADATDYAGLAGVIAQLGTKTLSKRLQTLLEQGTLDPDTENTLRYFQSLAALRTCNPQHISKLIMANFSSADDYMHTFLLCVATGLIQVEGGEVVDGANAISLMQLFESADDHLKAHEVFNQLAELKLFQQFLQQKGEYRVMTAYSDTPRQSGMPYAILSIWFGITNLFNKVQSRFPAVKFIHQKGNGASGYRSGGAGIDNELYAREPSWFLHLLRTWQPGLFDYDTATPTMAKAALLRHLHNTIPDADTAHIDHELQDPAFQHFMLEFARCSQEDYQERILLKGGDFDRLLKALPSTWFALNEAGVGSRSKGLRNLHELKDSIVGGERMIKVTHVLRELGYDATTVTSFVSTCSKQKDMIPQLQEYLGSHQVCRYWLYKIEEQLALSSEVLLEACLKDPAFAEHQNTLQQLIDDLRQARDFMNQILGQQDLFARRAQQGLGKYVPNKAPSRVPLMRLQRWQQEEQSRLSAPLFFSDRAKTAIAPEGQQTPHRVFSEDTRTLAAALTYPRPNGRVL